jgi:ABC-type transport system involved in cytochrome c biogenesis permease subunit
MNQQLKVWSLAFIGLISSSTSSWAASGTEGGLCFDPELGKQPILAEGRVIPLAVHAAHVRKFIFQSSCKELSATTFYCLLSTGKADELKTKHQCDLNIKVDHVNTMGILGLKDKNKTIAFDAAFVMRQQLIDAYTALEKEKKETGGQGVDLANVLHRMDTYSSIEKGMDWKVLTEGRKWVGLSQLGAADDQARNLLIYGGTKLITEQEASQMKWETVYERVHPFMLAFILCLGGFLVSLVAVNLPRYSLWAVAFLVAVLVIEVFGVTARVMISGRGPVTNMYETVLWSGLAVFLMSIVLGLKVKDKRMWAVGFAGNAICLFMMNFAPSMLDGSIRPLVPVLRDNFWLSTHVTTITFSYGCLALSWFIANYTLLREIIKPGNDELIKRWNYVNRLTIQIGTVFLAAGIILGGVWADYSWGRFWGWDPKETWSLIALIIYMSILHGRYVGWFKDKSFVIATALGFLSVLMAWFGVNYILAVGLHSYGFSSGGAAFLITVFFTQIVIVALAILRDPQGSAPGKVAPKSN